MQPAAQVVALFLMLKITTKSPPSSGSAELAEELFLQHRQKIYRQTDRIFAILMLGQWLVAILLASVISPRTWSGESSALHVHLWMAIFLGGAISI
ncbi:MAG: hypothetical protein M3119_11085, partial [Verrucomicrobiota bacterium]|nr:hypothetical protein [Verrucomicrobiota bacterium]